MTLRKRLLIYLLFLHGLILGGGIALLMADYRPWILLLEIVVAVSLIIGIRMTRSFNLHLELVSTGSEFIRERDFAHTFTEVQAEDLNKLVLLYNEMITRLREERTHNEEHQYFLEKLVEASPTGMIILDPDGVITTINPAAQGFFSPDGNELAGTRLRESANPILQQLAGLETGEAHVFQIENRRQVKAVHSQYFDRGFANSFFLLVELTEELWKSEKHAYETLIRTLSHEVNNTVGATNSILRSCLGYAEQLEKDDRNDFENALTVAIDRNDNLNRFMKSYADVIRLPEPTRETVNMNQFMQRIVHLVEPQLNQQNIQLKVDIPENLGICALDIAQMEQVFINLIRNAQDAMGENGILRLAGKRNQKSIELEVGDNGSGIPQDIQARLFTPFFSTKPNGQGIGLTLVQQILSRHGFDYHLDSAPNQGTSFTIRIPH